MKKNLLQFFALFLCVFLLTGFTFRQENYNAGNAAFNTPGSYPGAELNLKSGTEEIKKLMNTGSFDFAREKNPRGENDRGFDLDSKSKELNVDKNDLSTIMNQVRSETGDDDPVGTDAITQQVITGYGAGNYFGISVSGAGDVNGDGYSDIIVGASGYSSNTGRVYLYLGSSSGINTTPAAVFTGEAAGNWFGGSVSDAGDVNGDGYDDVIVGALGYSSNTGRAYLYLGSSSGINTTPAAVLTGETNFNSFGVSVSGAGDVNGDGYSDIIVGAEGYSNFTGRAYLYLGSSSGINTTPAKVLTGEAPSGSGFGVSVSGAGDVNGDGYSDIIVGADGYSDITGRAYIYLGSSSGINTTPAAVLTEEAIGNFFGTSVSGAGDVNGDGYSDIIVGADGYSSYTGRAYLYHGSSSGINTTAAAVLTGQATINGFGVSVSDAGDVNGDGYSDIIVGANGFSSNTGRTYLYLGTSSGINTTAAAVLTGQATNNRFGYSVSGAGDVNGDGYSDIIVGANGYSSNTGRIYLYTNSMTGYDIPDFIFTGEAASNSFGYSVSDAGDVNGDGYQDIIVGADGYSSNTGRVYLYHGSSSGINTTPAAVLTGEGSGNFFGRSVSGAGDVNGDGYADIIVGADGYISNAGRTYIYLGTPSGINTTAAAVLTGEVTGNFFGTSVSGAGDVNGDGYADIIVGARGYSSNTGRAYLYLGNSSGVNTTAAAVLTGEATSNFGISVSDAGDVNGDGYSDIIVGANGYSSNTGRAYLYLGRSSGINTTATVLTGEATGNQFGRSVSDAGDVNGDGYDDVIVGALGYSSNTGRAYIYHGSSSGINTAAAVFTGEGINNSFGRSVSGAGDVNGDGYPDIIVGAEGYSSNTGRAYIYFGGRTMDNVQDVILSGENTANFFGISVANIGDINKDGLSDVIVGAFGFTSFVGRAYLYMSSAPVVKPRIVSVKDVPNDQGGFVHVRWMRSGYDFPGINKITNYLVERSRPPDQIGFSWEAVATIPAGLNPSYTYTASTWSDSNFNGSSRIFFRITARTENINEFWRSNIVSGQSIDNLAPVPPIHLSASQTQTSVNLEWQENSEPDMHYYNIYRNDSLIATSTANSFTDNIIPLSSASKEPESKAPGNSFSNDNMPMIEYNVSAVDINNNESNLSDPVNVNFAPFTALNVTIIPEGFYNTTTEKLNSRDTVWAYLRNITAPYSIVDSASGVIDSITFTANFEFRDANDGIYYIVIKHRNSLETWSKTGGESYERGVAAFYDFTNDNSQSYGSNMIQKNSKWCIISGDIYRDGIIDANDRGICWNAKNLTGYRIEDVNGDGVVDAQDRGITWNNRNKTVQRPE